MYDIDLFATVQLLEDTPAVLSLGKLCEEHGYTYEWACGQQQHLTKQGKKILCTTENIVPLVVPVVQFWYQFALYIATAGIIIKYIFKSTLERSDEPAPRNWRDSPVTLSKSEKRDTSRASDDRLRDFPEWLEERTENLEDTEVLAPAHSSHDSDSERPTKVASRKHSIFNLFPKDRNCEVCLRTKNDKGSLQKTHWRSSTSSRKVW